MPYDGARRTPSGGSPGTRDAVQVGLVTPWQGPAGMFGLSCRMCAELAVAEINLDGGLLGRPVELHHVDGGADPGAVALEVQRLVRTNQVDAVVGWHISAVRRRLAPRIAAQVPYVYTALYEGGERTPGVLLTGETPANQLGPALEWMRTELGVRRWAVVGDDYVWPRASAAEAARWARAHDVPIVDEVYVPLGTRDFGPALRTLARGGADGVLVLLVGEDAVHFNRAFAAAGLDRWQTRLSTLMDETMLLASGERATRSLYSAAGYFEDLTTTDALEFGGRFAERFGATAPVPSSLGESCYEGMNLYAQLVRDAGTTGREEVLAVSEQVRFGGARGEVTLRRSHVVQDVYIARAQGVHFEVIARLSSGIRES
ncbi:substrate-binding domain-containing protein [Actinomycetospora corticicola]|uniref:ABC-type branched-subunit amino acid transport system substrate-binding protein n=1 Tax=Actinomycetospora corticicola TaxID=663602 RepID=A0A7Y9J6A9_9PSEU|nr:ABC-type branched-subunit amino acid transport system substrate-binding protein [Actinomycetospora corticicola]